ncbi:ABC-2 type transporter [Nesidiocoris tenuis]|uniref:ABC-2 type transporter n=1 Tax=Nesidiocoris tenuis TaxID=355587 RepID=A0ABN7AZ71_9HEMI|nr:ABC-2 type transporter [Nesidiocoris tenuis]
MSGSVGGRKLMPQQSTVWTRRQNAVAVRRACKMYGPKSSRHIVLDSLNMTVPKGCIYGLLGASGCGKTTLLSCIVGRRRLNSGEIWVLGGQPGSKGSGVPGPRVGYMPQELALYGEFTIKETLKYFGWIAGMSTEDIETRTTFLLDLLQLPFPERHVKNLSGGQQRRVSMAATFLHEPELLILDEPTSGVDPVLRQKIWNYLVELVASKTTTVIITTHYIDETKQATTVGLMRGGKFLAEESPEELLRRYNSDSLEDAFLKLSILQNRGKRRRSSITSSVLAANAASIPELQDMPDFETQSEISGEFGDNMSLANVKVGTGSEPPSPTTDPVPPEDEVESSWTDNLKVYTSHHMKALIWKNMLWMCRNIGVLIFTIAMPIFQTTFFCLAIGHDPAGLKLAVVNNERPGMVSCEYNQSCYTDDLGCRYLDHLATRKHDLIPYDSYDEALYALKKGWAWGIVDIPYNFSSYLTERLEMGKNADDVAVNGSDIDIQLDMSNKQIAVLLQRDFVLALEEFAKSMAESCNISANLISLPVKFQDPVYGPRIPNFTNFAAPGVMLTIVFFLSVALTSGTMLIERNEGILERCLVSGITGVEILSSHVVTQFIIMVCQAFMVVFFAVYVYNVEVVGSLFTAMVLIILSGTCGMTYGFAVSCVCDSERNAVYLALGSFLPFVMLCGIIWPVEGMNSILRTVAWFLPLTLSTESLRSVLGRGWGMDSPQVYGGFISTGIWILIYLLASVLILKYKKG